MSLLNYALDERRPPKAADHDKPGGCRGAYEFQKRQAEIASGALREILSIAHTEGGDAAVVEIIRTANRKLETLRANAARNS